MNILYASKLICSSIDPKNGGYNPHTSKIIKNKIEDPMYNNWEITNDDIDDKIDDKIGNDWEVIEIEENNGHNMEMKEKIDLNFLKKN